MDLTTKYLGLKLRSPLVVSASPMSEDIDNIKRMEDAGAAAVVLYSLFEEQLRQDRLELNQNLQQGTESFAEALTYFPEAGEYRLGPEEYLKHIAAAKKATGIPIIASLNGSSVGGWTDYARQIQQAGADALELNIYYIPTDMDLGGDVVEDTYINILRAVKANVTIPVAVKLSPFFSNFANMAKRLDRAGAVQPVLPAGHRAGITGGQAEHFVEHADGGATAVALDRAAVWPRAGESGGDQRHPSRLRCAENAAGGRGCDHALLHPAPPRHPADRPHRTRPQGVAGGTRIRIGPAAQGQLEPEKMRGTGGLRARPIHEGADRLHHQPPLTRRWVQPGLDGRPARLQSHVCPQAKPMAFKS